MKSILSFFSSFAYFIGVDILCHIATVPVCCSGTLKIHSAATLESHTTGKGFDAPPAHSAHKQVSNKVNRLSPCSLL